MVRHPNPPRQPRVDQIAAQHAMQGMQVPRGPALTQDVTPSLQFGPLKGKGDEPGPVFLIKGSMGSIYTPVFALMRPYGYILFSHEKDQRPFDQIEILLGEFHVPVRQDVTEYIWNDPQFFVSIVPREEWMMVTREDAAELEAYLDKQLEAGDTSLSLEKFLAQRQPSSQSAGTEAGGESDES